MVTQNISRKFIEDGVVISKIIKKATSEFTDQTGKRVQAQPERYVVTVVSSSEFTPEYGYENPSVLEFKVEREIFDKMKYLTPVRAKIEFAKRYEI